MHTENNFINLNNIPKFKYNKAPSWGFIICLSYFLFFMVDYSCPYHDQDNKYTLLLFLPFPEIV